MSGMAAVVGWPAERGTPSLHRAGPSFPSPPKTHQDPTFTCHCFGVGALQLLLHQAGAVLVTAEGVQVALEVLQGGMGTTARQERRAEERWLFQAERACQ